MKTRGLKFPILTLISIVIIGTIGFHFIEEESLLDSFYWTVVTIMTVGYGDITPSTELGKAFSIVLMAVGIGAILYTLTTIGRNIVEGRIWRIFMKTEKNEEVKKLEDHLVICGYGDVGKTVTQELLLGNEDLVIVDTDKETLRKEASDLPYIIGDATKEEVLETARIEKAKGLFATLPSDSDNILLTLIAKDINPEIRIVTKAETTEGAKHLRRAGAESIVLPEREGGMRMARSFLHPEITSLYDHLLMGNITRAETVEVDPEGPLDRITIKESKIREEIGASIIAIKRDEELITNPGIDQEIKGGDTLILMGTLSQIKKLRKRLSQKSST